MSGAVRLEGVRFTYPSPPAPLRVLMGAGRPTVEVLRGLSFALAAGERVCLMGPNGAGKTTLLKLLLGLLAPTAGTLSVLGGSPDDAATRRRVGFAHADERSFYWRLSVAENLLFFGRLWGLSAADAERRCAGLAEGLEMRDLLPVPFARLSSGQRQKAVLARALLHDPELVVMDEPTRSLDVHAAARFRELLAGPALAGRALLVATHDPAEAAALAPRCLVLSGGALRHDGPPLDPASLDGLMGGNP